MDIHIVLSTLEDVSTVTSAQRNDMELEMQSFWQIHMLTSNSIIMNLNI